MRCVSSFNRTFEATPDASDSNNDDLMVSTHDKGIVSKPGGDCRSKLLLSGARLGTRKASVVELDFRVGGVSIATREEKRRADQGWISRTPHLLVELDQHADYVTLV